MHQSIPQQKRSQKQRVARVALALLLLLTTLLLAAPVPAYACSCVEGTPPRQALDRAAAVFAGTVLDVNTFALPLLDNSLQPVRVTFEVNQVWKGEVAGRAVIRTAQDSAACGYDFAAGTAYLVYAYQSEDGLATGLCERTTEITNAGEDLAVLGIGDAPLTAGERSPIWLPLVLGGAFFFLVIGAVLAFAILRARPVAREDPV